MPAIQPPQPDDEFDGDGTGRRRKLVRYGVPVAVAGIAATTIGLGTALASTSSGPSLPHITAEQLLDKIATSKVQTLSGTVRVSTDFGLPDALMSGVTGGLTSGGAGGKGGASADPQPRLAELLSGTHTLQVAADGPTRQRVSILDGSSDYSVVHNGDQLWAYDSATNSVFHTTRPQGRESSAGPATRENRQDMPATPQQAVQQALTSVDPTTSVSVGGTAQVAGRSAYELVIKPKQADSTVDAIRVDVDASNGVPLSFTLTPKDGGPAAVDIAYTTVDFGRPAASTFDFTVPKGAKVTEGTKGLGADQQQPGLNGAGGSAERLGQGWTTIAELKAGKGQGSAANGKELSSLSSLGIGHQVRGAFGSGTVISTRLVNALITDKGTAYIGAVSQGALIRAADAGR
ncbi:DUF2092 domain-containing protein [Streptomyces sp. RB6PN25]|uniref:DUF2092 domain-containing protein n=1 Tax=Streptomyces humicola TaxID=2953240 RepID=A0ABT1PW89_9ACTN|nr:DUF2092 domain-containing protein [Streptomyces humicola]MCQ4081280.1 DUF2092 domain-containing protein [Streptomyces humicola]